MDSFVIKSVGMNDDTHFYQRPWFQITSRIVLMLGLYGYAVYSQWKAGTLSIVSLFVDIILFGFLLLIWVAFFAQFILPVRTFPQRQKIFDRLVAYMGGMRGPALFIKNGRVIERSGESERKGPGVIWLDSASAAVTHVNTSFKNVFGPGVHFTDGGEKIIQANVVDLHVQSKGLGPGENDDSFMDKEEAEKKKIDKEKYEEIQKRRRETSALTRDGIEVVPRISVTFKIDADPFKGDQPGSHFGYREEAVKNAVINQAINPNEGSEKREHEVAWNELPVYIAADLWREYMSKFKLNDLFEPNFSLPASVPMPVEAPSADADALLHPVLGKKQGKLEEALTGMLHEINTWLGKLIERCEGEQAKKPAEAPRPTSGNKLQSDVAGKTALQVINMMIKERMTNPKAPILDENGVRTPGSRESAEYALLKNRGIRVISASVSNLRFPPRVEEQLIHQWTANWLVNARAERDRIETERSYATLSGKEKALTDYTRDLTRDLLNQRKTGKNLKEAVKTLLLRTRMILVRNDRMHRRASTELQELEEILQWLETTQP